MDVLDKTSTLADARVFMMKALNLLDNAEAWETGAHLDKAIRTLDDVVSTPPDLARSG